jgi:hypothetical protein
MKILATLLLGLALYVPVCAQDKPKLAELQILGDMISVDGFWEPDNPTKQNEVVPNRRSHRVFPSWWKRSKSCQD